MKDNILFDKERKNSAKQIAKTSFLQKMHSPKLDLFDFNYENKYKQFLCETFYLNNITPPLAGFIVGFGPDDIKKINDEVKTILNELKRKYLFIEADGKSFIQCIRCHTGKHCTTFSDVYSILNDIFLNTDSVVIFSEFSRCKISGDKASFMRSIIKKMEQRKKIASDLVFIDYAAFYHEAKELLVPYIRCMGKSISG